MWINSGSDYEPIGKISAIAFPPWLSTSNAVWGGIELLSGVTLTVVSWTSPFDSEMTRMASFAGSIVLTLSGIKDLGLAIFWAKKDLDIAEDIDPKNDHLLVPLGKAKELFQNKFDQMNLNPEMLNGFFEQVENCTSSTLPMMTPSYTQNPEIDKQLHSILIKLTDLQSQLKNKQEEFNRAKTLASEKHTNEIQTLTSSKEEAQNALSEAQAQHKVEIEKLKSDKETVDQELASMKEKHAEEITILTSSKVEAENALAEAQEKYKAEIENLTSAKTSVDLELASMKEKHAEEITALTSSKEKAENALAEAQSQHTAEIEKLTSAKTSVDLELASMKEKHAEEVKTLTSSKEKAENALAEAQSQHTAEIEKLTSAKTRVDQELASMKEKHAEKIKTLTSSKVEAQTALAEAQSQHTEEINKLNEKHRTAFNKTKLVYDKFQAKNESRIDELETEIKTLTQTITDLTNQLQLSQANHTNTHASNIQDDLEKIKRALDFIKSVQRSDRTQRFNTVINFTNDETKEIGKVLKSIINRLNAEINVTEKKAKKENRRLSGYGSDGSPGNHAGQFENNFGGSDS